MKRLFHVRLIDLLVAATVYGVCLTIVLFINSRGDAFTTSARDTETLLIQRWPLHIQGMLLIPFALLGSTLLTRGTMMKTENDWRRGGIQLIAICSGLIILIAPFVVRDPWPRVWIVQTQGICPVHKTPMVSEEVTIDTEIHIHWAYEYLTAREKEFPHAGEDYPTGGRNSITARIPICPKCQEAREAWIRAHYRK